MKRKGRTGEFLPLQLFIKVIAYVLHICMRTLSPGHMVICTCSVSYTPVVVWWWWWWWRPCVQDLYCGSCVSSCSWRFAMLPRTIHQCCWHPWSPLCLLSRHVAW